MINILNSALALTGKSGKIYSFNLSTFDNWDDIKDGFKGHGLYLFSNRSTGGNHNLIYLGMVTELETRFYCHHKKDLIVKHGANCLGVCQMNNSTKDGRKAAESDLLAAYNFPCNDQEN